MYENFDVLRSYVLELLKGFVLNGDDKTQYGQLGDYVGGVWGTIISVATLIVVWRTWISTRRASHLQSIMAMLAEMLKTHDAIAESGEFTFWDRRGAPSLFLREFAAIYRQTRKAVPSDDIWPVEYRIDIAYTFAFYGLNTQARHSLARYGDQNLKAVQDSVSILRHKAALKGKRLFNGHQAGMSHYFRNLFGMYNLIDKSNIPYDEKIHLSKIIRTKLSNYDQAILALNVISHLGRAWETDGFIRKYKPFSNIPERFFGFDERFNIKERFPIVAFEWEQMNVERVRYKRLSIMRWTLHLETRPKKNNGAP